MSGETREQFEREEQAYWRQQDELLKQYPGKWVAIVGGTGVAVGNDSGNTLREAIRKTGSRVGYLAHVGAENEVERIRRIAVGYYDLSYQRPLPKVRTTVTHVIDPTSTDVDLVADTGTDITLLREDVGGMLGVWDSAWRTAYVSGVGSAPVPRQRYALSLEIAGKDVMVAADCRDDIDEDILGRDVINEFSRTVCAKRDQVEFQDVDETSAGQL